MARSGRTGRKHAAGPALLPLEPPPGPPGELAAPWHGSELARPFQLDGDPREPRAVLLLHGFSGSPYEVHLLGRAVAALGYPCAAPLLHGHYATTRALGASGWPDWLASAEAALHALRSRTAARSGQAPRVAVLGLSMGGLLTLELARRFPAEIQAIGVMSSPLWLPRWQERCIRALGRGRVTRRLAVPKLLGADVRERGLQHARLLPRSMPITSLNSLLDLMAATRTRLAEVRQPALLSHGARDHTAPYACLTALAEGLGTPPADLRVLSLPRSYHLTPIDVEREILFAAVAEHLHRHLGKPGTPLG